MELLLAAAGASPLINLLSAQNLIPLRRILNLKSLFLDIGYTEFVAQFDVGVGGDAGCLQLAHKSSRAHRPTRLLIPLRQMNGRNRILGVLFHATVCFQLLSVLIYVLRLDCFGNEVSRLAVMVVLEVVG